VLQQRDIRIAAMTSHADVIQRPMLLLLLLLPPL